MRPLHSSPRRGIGSRTTQQQETSRERRRTTLVLCAWTSNEALERPTSAGPQKHLFEHQGAPNVQSHGATAAAPSCGRSCGLAPSNTGETFQGGPLYQDHPSGVPSNTRSQETGVQRLHQTGSPTSGFIKKLRSIKWWLCAICYLFLKPLYVWLCPNRVPAGCGSAVKLRGSFEAILFCLGL